MRVFRRPFVLGLLLACGLSATPLAQPFSTQIQIAINQLTTGVTPFTQLALSVSRYINWGTTQGLNGYGLRDNAGVIEVKNLAGTWTPVISGASGAPATASYWTRVTEVGLSNETALGALGTGLIINATGTGVPTIYAGVTCTNQFLRALSASGAGTCASVNLANDTTGSLGVSRGGTGLSGGTSGGVLAFTGATAITSSVELTVNQIVLGGGAGATPTPLGSLGSGSTVLHGNGAGAPTFAAVNLSTEVTGTLAVARGGTGTAFFGVSGPSALRTYIFPDANATILTTDAAVAPSEGGTGIQSYTTGDILYASGSTTLAKLADGSTGNALITGGVGVAPSYGKIGLTTHITGTLGPTNGGTGFAAFVVGDLLYANSTTSWAKLASVAAGSYLRAGGVTTAPTWSTATLPNTTVTGDLLYASASNVYANLTGVAVGQVLISGGVATAPAWSAAPRITSLLLGPNVALSATAPTISSGFGTSPSVTAGTATSFRVDIGTGGTATAGIVAMPTATTGWNCHVEDLTARLANVGDTRTVQLSSTTATVTVENQTVSTGAVVAWTASDILSLVCVAF